MRLIALDHTDDVIGSIRHAIRTAAFIKEDPQSWKWVCLALHSALQGACISHLMTTCEPLGAVTDHNAEEWLRHLNDEQMARPRTYLAPLPDLLKKIRKPNSAGDGSESAGIHISESEIAWLLRFHHEIRNQLIHFEPMGWTVDVSGVSDLAAVIARIIGQIVDHGWGFRHVAPDRLDGLRDGLHRLRNLDWPNDQ